MVPGVGIEAASGGQAHGDPLAAVRMIGNMQSTLRYP
jgi:hypothetical protein